VSSWRDTILQSFVPGVSRLTLVADPDGLLTEEKLAQILLERGFELIEFNDTIEFRYAYESKYRSLWDRGEHTDLLVILRLESSELDSLPYDLLAVGNRLSFSLGALFPSLSYPIIEQLDRALLDRLYSAQPDAEGKPLGDNASRDFILLHGYGICPALIKSDVDLLKVLLSLHYKGVRLPLMLCERVRQLLYHQGVFQDWPLLEMFSDSEMFFSYLQERWPLFLKMHTASSQGGSQEVCEESINTNELRLPGPPSLNFAHHDIKVFIDNLFVEGKLTPIPVADGCVISDDWVQCGIVHHKEEDAASRISRLLDRIRHEMPTIDHSYTDWISLALKWAELSSLVRCSMQAQDVSTYKLMGDQLNEIFSQWLRSHYSSLRTLSATNLAMLHHLPRHLARELESTDDARVALIVMDGLALDQWVTMRNMLQQKDDSLVIRESATFAWIPTLTSVSRQAIFSGKEPFYFPSSIHSTHKEEALWRQFWDGCGVSGKSDVAYLKGLGDGDAVKKLEQSINLSSTRVVGLVIDKVDKIMHGMQLGSEGMHNQIRQWCEYGFLAELVNHLLDHKYSVWLTSDHGNTECHGSGRINEGVMAETRGERVRVYQSPELRDQVAASHETAFAWQPNGLPDGYFPLFASGRDAFVTAGDSIVGHGGVSIEEVIVPLVKFERSK